MADVIYGPQVWTAADFSSAAYRQSTTYGGSDAPLTGYPEVAIIENLDRGEGGGPSGENVADALNTANYTVASLFLESIGPLTNGQYDCRELWVKFDIKLKSSALAEAGYSVPLVLANQGNGGAAGGLFSAQVFLQLAMNQTAGASFDWALDYRAPSGSFGTHLLEIAGPSDVADNAWHEIKVKLTPSTIVGAFGGTGFEDFSGIGSDGAITVYKDSVPIITGTGLQWLINQFGTSNPGVYYGRALWHGD